MTAPTVLIFAWVLLGTVVTLASVGQLSLSIVRFAAALAFGISGAAAIRVWEASGRRGDTWDGLFVAAPLPYFDSELRGRVVRTKSSAAALCGALLALASLSGAALLAFATPAERGFITLSEGAATTAWADTARGGVGRELPVELSVAGIEPTAGVLEVGASRVQDDWESGATLAPGQSMLVGGLEVEWIGVLPEERISSVTLDVVVDGESERADIPVGGSAEVLGRTVRVTEFEPNRLGALGPAARVAVDSGESVYAAWVHLWSPESHPTFGAGDTSIALRGLAPASAALLTVRTPWPSWFFPLLTILAGLAAALALRFVTSPVFIRGRSGDYELVGPNRRTVEAAARALLNDADHSEWQRLLVTLRATGRATL